MWNPQVHYCAQRHNHRQLQMNPVCTLTLCSRSLLRFGWSIPFLASLKPTDSFYVLRDPKTGPCKRIQSVGAHYIPDLYIALDFLLPYSPLWNPRDHYCAQRHNYLPLQMNTVCRLTLCSRFILRFVRSLLFLVSVKPTFSLLCSETQKPALANYSSL
jgi:hypothetical protein